MASDKLTGAKWRKFVRRNWERVAAGWDRWDPYVMQWLAGVDPTLFRHLDLRSGHRVLDLASGSGDPAIQLAQLVAPHGEVVAMDVSRPMIDLARRRAHTFQLKNLRFRIGDMASLKPALGRFDRASCRFGIFFVEDMEASLVGIRSLLKRGGRAAFAVWGPTETNDAWRLRAETLEPYIDPAVRANEEASPGPMRLTRRESLPRLMRRAGFKKVKSEEVIFPIVMRSGEEYWQMTADCSASLDEFLAKLPRTDQNKIRQGLIRRSNRYKDGESIRIPSSAWVVSGER